MSQGFNPNDPQPGKSGGGSRVLLFLGVGCGVLVLICCGGIGIAFWGFSRAFNFSDDPAKIVALTETITPIKVPDTLQPVFMLDGKVPFQGDQLGKMVVYGDRKQNPDSSLFMGEVNKKYEAQARMQLDQAKAQQEKAAGKELKVDKATAETIDATVNGADASFKIVKGTEPSTDDEYWELTGEFEGKGGPAFLGGRLKASEFTKEDVIKLIDSMKSP